MQCRGCAIVGSGRQVAYYDVKATTSRNLCGTWPTDPPIWCPYGRTKKPVGSTWQNATTFYNDCEYPGMVDVSQQTVSPTKALAQTDIVSMTVSSAWAIDGCGSTIGEVHTSEVVSIPRSQVYSVCTNGAAYPYHFDDPDGLLPASAWSCQDFCTNMIQLSISHPSWNELVVNSRVVSDIGGHYCAPWINQAWYRPWVAVPPQVRALDPAWAFCGLAFQGWYDPPTKHVPVSQMQDPGSSQRVGMMTYGVTTTVSTSIAMPGPSPASHLSSSTALSTYSAIAQTTTATQLSLLDPSTGSAGEHTKTSTASATEASGSPFWTLDLSTSASSPSQNISATKETSSTPERSIPNLTSSSGGIEIPQNLVLSILSAALSSNDTHVTDAISFTITPSSHPERTQGTITLGLTMTVTVQISSEATKPSSITSQTTSLIMSGTERTASAEQSSGASAAARGSHDAASELLKASVMMGLIALGVLLAIQVLQTDHTRPLSAHRIRPRIRKPQTRM